MTIIMPAYNEGSGIVPILSRVAESVNLPFECLVVVDDKSDSTISFVEEVHKSDPRFRICLNTLGKGPALAIRQGFLETESNVAVVTMADGSDDPRVIDDLVRLVERGVVIAAASRYMSGGQQVGASGFKSFLSRSAGRTLHTFARVGTHDATNSFKAFKVDFVKSVGIQSEHGFELGLELTAKARRLRLPVAEIPTIWLERESGDSNFQVRKWIPHYLAWYRFAYGKKLNLKELINKTDRMSK